MKRTTLSNLTHQAARYVSDDGKRELLTIRRNRSLPSDPWEVSMFVECSRSTPDIVALLDAAADARNVLATWNGAPPDQAEAILWEPEPFPFVIAPAGALLEVGDMVAEPDARTWPIVKVTATIARTELEAFPRTVPSWGFKPRGSQSRRTWQAYKPAKQGCPRDTDGDGNCPLHPEGCPK